MLLACLLAGLACARRDLPDDYANITPLAAGTATAGPALLPASGRVLGPAVERLLPASGNVAGPAVRSVTQAGLELRRICTRTVVPA